MFTLICQFLLSIVVITTMNGIRTVNGSGEMYFTDEMIPTGLLLPLKISVNIGEDVVLKINEIENQKRCLYRRTRTKESINVISATGNVERLGVEPCGIRLKNVSYADAGFWRLSSENDENLKQGVSFIEILNTEQQFDVRNVYLPLETFSPEGTRYCTVYRDDLYTSSVSRMYNEFPIYGECHIPNMNLDPERNGLWNVKVGLKGYTNEINFVVNIDSKQEKLVASMETLSSSYAVLKCNIENMKETSNITFCRFVRESDKLGMNLEPGGGNSKYNYYGNGFHNGECGMLISQPNTFDRSLWKCYIGIKSDHGTLRISTIGAILNLINDPDALITIKSESVYGLEEKSFDILCESTTAIQYCWFSHPNGTAYSVSDTIVEESETTDKYWYYGNGFQLGHCGITIGSAVLTDTGLWKCHVGTYKKSQLEISTEIDVRITESNIVAKDREIEVEVGENLMIECRSIPKNTPLEYCRFYLPSGVGFSINEDVVSSDPLANRYFFNPDHSLKYGYCSIIVLDVDMEHNGKWLCGSKLLGWNAESMDYINITVVGDDLGVAAIIGISVGVALIVILAAAYFIYRRHRRVVVTEDGTEL